MKVVTLKEENGNGDLSKDGMIAIEMHRRKGETGRNIMCFSLSRYFPDGRGGLEQVAQFEPADLPRLICVVQTLCGLFASFDELDEFNAKRLELLHDLLAEFMESSLERLDAYDEEHSSQLDSHLPPQ